MNPNKINKSASILIIGGGPAGLSAAYYLKNHGFKNVTVMERLGRVGGLCCSATEDYQSFELGAVIVPPSYRELHKIAKKVGMKLTPAWGSTAISMTAKKSNDLYHDLFTYEDEVRLKEQIAGYVYALGGRIRFEDDWHSYDVWHYFRHVDPADFLDGFYQQFSFWP